MRSYLYITVLQANNFPCEIQPNADSLYIMDIFFPIKAPKNCSLLVFGNPFAGIGNADFQVHFPAFNANTNRTQSRKSRQNTMLQNTTDISLVRIYRTENMTTDKSKMVVASIMQTLFKESFFEIIFALLQSTYSPYRKRF